MELEETINNYKSELNLDCHLDELNLKEQAMKLPGLKAKWVTRQINHKRELAKLNNLRKTTHKSLLDRVKTETNVELSNLALSKKIEGSDIIGDIDKRIEELEVIILYLEKVEAIFKGVSFDIANSIKLIQLETQ
jgi:hypothetical protein